MGVLWAIIIHPVFKKQWEGNEMYCKRCRKEFAGGYHSCINPVQQRFVVLDNEFNRANCPDEIGNIYINPPSYMVVKPIGEV